MAIKYDDGKGGSSLNPFVRRWFEDPPFEHDVASASFETVAVREVVRTDSVVVVPFYPDSSSTGDVNLQVQISYDEPRFDDSKELITGGNTWHQIPGGDKTVSIGQTPDEGKILLHQFTTGITMIRIRVAATSMDAPAKIGIHVKGFNIHSE